MILRTLRILGLVLGSGLALAGPAWADATAELNIQDDRITETGGPGAAGIIQSWHNQLGVDSVRITAFWDAIETVPGRYDWSHVDTAVNLVRSAGMQPVITLSEKGPVSASQEPGRNDGRFKPDPGKFARFAGAAAARYAGRVTDYTIGNEPNQGTFLEPQRVGGRPFSPHWYRKLVLAAYPAIKANDHTSRVIIGVTAPIGGVSGGADSVAPLIFLREFGCRDRLYRPIRAGYCAGFRPARGDAYAQHPYTIRYKLPPFRHMPPELVGTGDWPRFFTVLDNLTRRGAILAPGGRFNVYITEYGYETNPPDFRFGVPPAVQNSWLQQAAYISWRTARIKMMNQYLYADDPGPRTTFQTGLTYYNLASKPSLGSFSHPFYVDIRPPHNRARAVVWGQVRPGGATTVTIEYSAGCSAYSAVATLRTNFRGYFARTQRVNPGCYRFRYPGGVSDSQRL